jgi:ABC transport system ATP-binding/permease protein
MASTLSPVILNAYDVSIRFGEQAVLNRAGLTIREDDRIGLIGSNGSGKSTLLKIIAGVLTPDTGTVSRRRDLLTGYLSQDFRLDEDKTVTENILEGAVDVIGLLRQYEALPSTSEQRHIVEEQIRHRDGWNLDNRIEAAMHSLNVPDGTRLVRTLSGGEKRRVALCEAIIARPNLLILDEPTNHLDTWSIEWMEEFLAKYSGACLFVTHDRHVLDVIARSIVEMSDGTCISHAGNYTDFLIDKAERETRQETEEKKRSAFLRRELEWVRRGPRARRTKSKSRLKDYYEAAEKQGYEAEEEVEFIIPSASPLGSTILNINSLGMSLGGQTLFRDLTFNFDKKRKLGIIGRNGLGKTTLLRIILGELPPDTGELEIGKRTAFNYVDQSRVALNDSNTVLQEIGEGREWITFGVEQMTVWTYLRRFLFADDRMNTRVAQLSGGERSRLLLAKILKNGGNFLILDEPTNDLDLATLRILEEALTAFDGCLIAVSHDRYFLNRVCNGILAFEGDGNVHFSEGDYDYYLEKRAARLAAVPESPLAGKKREAQQKVRPLKLKWKEEKELATIENDIMQAEGEVQRIEALFSAPDFYEKRGEQIAQLTGALENARKRVEDFYARWHELEALRSQAPQPE